VNPGSDRILAGELVNAIPGATTTSPDIPLAMAPAPGVQRVFRVAELLRMAGRYGWQGTPAADICVERPVTPPDPARYLAAMRKEMPDAEIEILDYGRQRVPEGELEFPRGALLSDGAAAALWTGHVRYAGTHKFAVWARVKVQVSVTRLIAVADLAPGKPIGAEQVRVETRLESPSPVATLTLPKEAIGRWPRAAVRSGMAIRAAMLEDPKEVVRGDTVTVEVSSGAAHLQLAAVAESSGAMGDTIVVLNPDSHKRFPARVEGKGRVSVADPTCSELRSCKVNP
jgi:flagella basal body P-ring formation protein FlgA